MKSIKKHPLSPGLVLSLGVTVVIALWGTWSLYVRHWMGFEKLGDAGLYGDMFGALNALFAGLAFVGVLAALAYQHRELMDSRADAEDLKASVQEMTQAMSNQARRLGDQNILLSDQNENSRRAEFLAATIASIEAIDRDLTNSKLRSDNLADMRTNRHHLKMDLKRITELNRTEQNDRLGKNLTGE